MARELIARDGPNTLLSIVGDEFRPYHPQHRRLLADRDHLAAHYTDLDSGRWVWNGPSSRRHLYNLAMNIAAALCGGNPRALGNTEEVVAYVVTNSSALSELFDCLYSDDEVVRMRAGDAVEKVCRQHPEWLTPYIDRLLTDIAAIDQPSVQWHLAQMMGALTLTRGQRRRAIEILKNNVETATDWIVQNYTLETLAAFVHDDENLRDYFIDQLRRHRTNPHKSVAKRASTLLAALDG